MGITTNNSSRISSNQRFVKMLTFLGKFESLSAVLGRILRSLLDRNCYSETIWDLGSDDLACASRTTLSRNDVQHAVAQLYSSDSKKAGLKVF